MRAFHQSGLKRAVVGVMGSAIEAPPFAEPLGEALAREGWSLLTGGGQGVMEAVSRGFVQSGVADRGLCIGVLPEAREENPWVELAIRTPLGIFDPADPERLTRNHINVLSSDALIVLPGRTGTRNEAELSLRYGRPAVLLGPGAEFLDFPPGLERFERLELAVEAVRELLYRDPSAV